MQLCLSEDEHVEFLAYKIQQPYEHFYGLVYLYISVSSNFSNFSTKIHSLTNLPRGINGGTNLHISTSNVLDYLAGSVNSGTEVLSLKNHFTIHFIKYYRIHVMCRQKFEDGQYNQDL